MGFLQWSSKYELGIPEMDMQHKKWLEILNNFYDHLSEKEINDNLKEMIDEIYNYTQYHFSEEEALMSKIGFQKLAEQKAMHSKISSQVEEFRNRIHSGKNIVSLSITSELKSWFKQHILIEDKKYADLYLTQKQ